MPSKFRKIGTSLDGDFRSNYDYNVDLFETETQALTDIADDLQEQVNQLIVDGDSSPEAAQARVDSDGTSYATLKARLDAKEQELSSTATQLQTDLNSVEEELPTIKSDIALVDAQIEKETEFSKPFPWYFAHRGARNVYQENTIKAFENCIARGNRFIELDVQKNADGALVVMHDDTLDRTTDGKWNVNLVSTGYMASRSVDDKVTAGEYGYEKEPIPTLNQVFEKFGRKTNYIIESKDQSSCVEIAAMVKQMKLEDFVMIQSFSSTDLRNIKDEGIRLMYLSNNVQPLAVNLFLLDNIEYLGCSVNQPDSYFANMINAGFKVFAYTVNHKYQHDRLQALGVQGYFSDDPWYLQNNIKLSADRFREKVFTDGMLACDGSDRGSFNTQTLTPYSWGFFNDTTKANERDFVVQGYLGSQPTSFTMNFKVQFENLANGWLSTAICLGKDYFDDINYSSSAGGYHLLFTESGFLYIYKILDTEAVKLAEYKTVQPVTTGTPISLKITVTASSIKFERLDIPYSITASDATKRGGYIAFGRRLVRGGFHDVSIT